MLEGLSKKQLVFVLLELLVAGVIITVISPVWREVQIVPGGQYHPKVFGRELSVLPIGLHTGDPQAWRDNWNVSCWTPPSGFKAWKAGVVTILTPEVQRNCTKLIARDKEEIDRVKGELKAWSNAVSDVQFLDKISNCLWVREYFNGNLYITELEKSFPVGYSFLIHDSPQQVIRLLRFLYRPHNVYCIHPDKKSSDLFIVIFRTLGLCLHNIIVPRDPISVNWGEYTIMEAQMLCLKELMLWREKQPEELKWRYVINLCGKEVPLATTHQIVTKLIKLNGSSSFIANKADKQPATVERLRGKTIPFDLPFYKSMTYGAISYSFSHFLQTNATALKVYEFFKGCYIPEEHFYATLYMIPGVPGGYDPKLKNLYFYIDFSIWLNGARKDCGGINVHNICVASVYELNETLRKTEDGRHGVFHNKHFMNMDPVVMDCMEEKLVANNKLEYKQDCPVN